MADPIIANSQQQVWEAIANLQKPVEPIQAPNTAWPVAPQLADIPVVWDTVDKIAPVNNDYLNLWWGKIVNKKSQQYQALIAKGMNDSDIIAAYQSKNKPTADQAAQKQPETPVATVQNNPVAQNNWLDYQSVQPERKTEIIDNLNKFYGTNPEMFSNRDSFNQAFDYGNGKRSLEQEKLLDNWYNQNINKVDMVSSLVKTPSVDIANQYMNGNLSNQQIDSIKSSDPAKYAEVNTEIEKQKTAQKYQEELNGTDKKEITPSELLQQKFNDILSSKVDSTIYDDYKNAINSDEMKWLQKDLTSKEWEIKEIDNQINASKSELEKQFKWQNISQGRLNAILQDQTQLLQNQRNTKAIEYQTLSAQYTNKLNTIKDTLDISEREKKAQQDEINNKMQQLWFTMQVMSYETPKQQDDRAWNNMIRKQDYLEGNINSPDPAIRKKAIGTAVDWVLKEFEWLPIKRSRDQIIDDISKQVDGGKSLWQAITENLRDPIIGKPEYKIWQKQKLGIDTKPFQVGDNTYIQNDDGTYSIHNYTPVDNSTWWGNYNWSTWGNMRTDRNNNPVAMTTDVAKTLWLVEWVDYVQWDSFTWGSWNTLYTAKLIWDPIQQVIKWLDIAANDPNKKAFYTQWWAQRWTHTAVSDEQWNNMTQEQKQALVVKMYHNEWGDWSLASWVQWTTNWPAATAAELAMFAKWAQYIWEKNWLSKARFNQIAAQQQANNKTDPSKQKILDTILWSGKFTEAQAWYLTKAINGWADPLTIVKNQAKSIMDSSVSTLLSKTELAKDQMSNLYNLVDKYYKNWGKTSYLSGNLEKVLNSFGEVKDPKLVDIATQIQVALQQYRNAISGTAYSDQEWKDISSVFPGINKSEWLNRAVLDARLQTFDPVIDSYYRNTLWPIYDELKSDSSNNIQKIAVQVRDPSPIKSPYD